LFRKWLWSLPLPNYLISHWSWSCLSFRFSQAIPPISQKVNCYPWHSICSRSFPTHQRCFNSFSSYKTSINMKSVGLVPEFHVLISVQNSAVFVLYPRRYVRISGAFRICQHCWHSHLV
jgi:hypothetical protein